MDRADARNIRQEMEEVEAHYHGVDLYELQVETGMSIHELENSREEDDEPEEGQTLRNRLGYLVRLEIAERSKP